MNRDLTVVEPVTYIAQVESLRKLRNKTRGTYSHFNEKISYNKQQTWWERESMQGRVKAWLYYERKPVSGEAYLSNDLIGFGMLRLADDGNWWYTVGVDPDWQGFGYGSYITHDLTQRAGHVIYSAVPKDNAPSIKAHSLDDWDFIAGPEERLVYFRSKSCP